VKKNALYENTAARGFLSQAISEDSRCRQIEGDSSFGNLLSYVNQPQPATGIQFSRSRIIKRVYDRSIDNGFEDSVPAMNPLLREVPPPMAAVATPGTSQRFTLDHLSFEKFLAAAWVLQCLHDQLHDRPAPSESIAEPVRTQEEIEPASLRLPAAMEPAVQPLLEVDHKQEVLSNRLADDETLAELVEAQQAIETGALDLDAAMRRVVDLSLKLTHADGSAVWLFARKEFSYRAGAGAATNNEKLRLAVLSSLAGAWPGKSTPVDGAAEASELRQSSVADLVAGATALLIAPIYHGLEVAGALAAFTRRSDTFSGYDTTRLRFMSGLLSHALRKDAEVELKTVEFKSEAVQQDHRPEAAARVQIAKPIPHVLPKPADTDRSVRHDESRFNLRPIFKGFAAALGNLRPALRVNLPLRALRAVAIATPVLLLAVVAALLIYESWHHESLRSVQAFTTANPPVEEVSNPSKAPDKAPRGLSADTRSGNTRKIDNETWQPGPATPREVSHKLVTDLATLSVVQQLSRYEMRVLRRQAKYGDGSAAFTLGMAYEIGHFVPQNCVEAARWVTTAAESGNAAAQYNLGLRYRDGDGVSANRTVSERWLRKAAQRNGKAKVALKMMASAQLRP